MRTEPVDSFALWTAQEHSLAFENKLRHTVTGIFPLDMIEGIIARGTTGEGIKARFKGDRREYLLDLFLRDVAFNEHMVLSQRPSTEVLIPGQDNAVLLERKTDNFVVVQRPIVEDVESEETKTLRELAQHDICYEFHI